MPRDGPDEPVKVPEGREQCDDCGAVVDEEQVLTKETPSDNPNIDLCPACQ